MANDLPRIGQDLVENNKATAPFYLWFSRIQSALAAGTITDEAAAAAIAAIATALGSPDGTVANIPPLNFLPKTTFVHEGVGIDVVGTLAGGGVDVSLEPLADTGVGAALVKITRDAYGRVEGTEAADTDDLPEGVTNLYFTNERAQDAVGNAVDGTGDVPLSYDDPTGAISAALSAAVLASLALADSAVQSVVAGTNVTVDATDPQNPIVSATGGGSSEILVTGAAGPVALTTNDETDWLYT